MELSKFNTSRFENTIFRALFVGTAKAGKTTYLKSVLAKILNEYEAVIIFAPKGSINQYKYLRQSYPHIHFGFITDITTPHLNDSINGILAQRERNKMDDGPNGEMIFRKKIMFLFDDVTNGGFVKGNVNDTLWTSSRHWGASIFFLIQRTHKLITPTMKSNMTHLIMFYCGDEKSAEEFYQIQIQSDTRMKAFDKKHRKGLADDIMRRHINFAQHAGLVIDKGIHKLYMI